MGDTSHAGVLAAAQPFQRGAFIAADFGEFVHALDNANRVSATDAHATTGLNRQAIGFDNLQERFALFDHNALALDQHLRAAGQTGVMADQRLIGGVAAIALRG